MISKVITITTSIGGGLDIETGCLSLSFKVLNTTF